MLNQNNRVNIYILLSQNYVVYLKQQFCRLCFGGRYQSMYFLMLVCDIYKLRNIWNGVNQ